MGAGAASFPIQEAVPFADSAIWEAQAAYYSGRGVDAWRRGEVPHHVSCNPAIAAAYASIAFAFHRDLTERGGLPAGEALLLCELGAGSGRFAYHLLGQLAALCADGGVAPESFLYVLTDSAQANLDFWRAHPRFAPLFDAGLLDLALFDVTKPGALALQVSGRTIGAGCLQAPLVGIANYLFDSIAPDLFRFRMGRAFPCLAALAADEDLSGVSPAEFLAKVRIGYSYAPPISAPYPEAALQRVFDGYRRTLRDTHLPFPAAAMRCLKSLSDLSRGGLLVLSADKGEHRLAGLEGLGPPPLERHGAVSLPVAYHALARFCEECGGRALLPAHDHGSIVVAALMMLPHAERFHRTRSAYRDHVTRFGPDDLQCIARQVRSHIPSLSLREMLAYLRLSRHDAVQFGRFLPRLTELAAALEDGERAELCAAAEKVWSLYFPIGEEPDLASGIAGLLYAMDDFDGALSFFEQSAAIYGSDPATLYNVACCRHMLGRQAEAIAALAAALQQEPDHPHAAALLAACEAALRAVA